MASQSKHEKDCRRNSGYWDGYSAKGHGHYPMWAKSWIARQAHPSDTLYGVAFWQGYCSEPHPVSGAVPGTPEFTYYSG